MTRTWIGIVLLAALLLMGVYVQNEMEAVHQPIGQMLELSAQRAQEENWDAAQSLFEAASGSWQNKWKLSAALADHEPMEEIDSLFARLEVFGLTRDAQEYAATCRELARRVDAMADAHRLNWWNLL